MIHAGPAGAVLLLTLIALSGCGDGAAEVSGDAGCGDVPAVGVGVGERLVVDPAATRGCVVLQASEDRTVEYLLVAVSAAGQQVPAGIEGPYSWRGSRDVALEALRPQQARRAERGEPGRAGRFHAALRARESAAAGRPRSERAALRLVPPPLPGAARTFQVCGSLACESFVPVTASARYVGRRVALFVDDTVPPGGFDAADLAAVGTLFDDYLHPIDTTAFGRESDLDGDGVVNVLLSDAVNALSGDCADGSVVLGYFLGTDLLPAEPGSNGGEVFYSRVPSSAAPACRADRASVLRLLAPTFIHEFQHMISFNQHVLLRAGPPEAVWLNEALSQFAEELGARLIPDGPAQGDASSRQAQFLTGNLQNALDYLFDPEGSHLVVPGLAFGTPAERGAGWLFLRWAADLAGGDDVRGTALTRALLATADVGAANVAARAGVPFDELVTAWQLANYLDDLPGFLPSEPGLRYRSINLRTTLASLWPTYPLRPDSLGGASYRRDGVLRAGSGRHLRVVLPAGAAAVALRLSTAPDGGTDPLLAPRIGIVRVR